MIRHEQSNIINRGPRDVDCRVYTLRVTSSHLQSGEQAVGLSIWPSVLDIEWWDVMPLFPFLRVCPRWLYTDTLPVAWPCVSPSEPSPAHARTPSHPPPAHITLADTGIHSEKYFRWLLHIEMVSWKWNSWGDLVLRRWDFYEWQVKDESVTHWVTLFPVD